MQAVAAVHDTELSVPSGPPGGVGGGSIDQLVPSQVSTRGSETLSPAIMLLLVLKLPTAVHAVGDEHETPFSELYVAPGGFGVDWIDQVEPFHCSTRVIRRPVLPANEPTAVQATLEAHETPFSPTAMASPGDGAS